MEHMMLKKGDLVLFQQLDGDPDEPTEIGIVVEDQSPFTRRALVRWMWGDVNLTNEPIEWLKLLARGNRG